MFWKSPDAPKLHVSTEELRNTVNLDIPITAVKWQIFQWPNDDGFIPVPDVYTLLIAEIELANPSWYKPHGILEHGLLDRDSARPWLSEPFKSLMTKAATDEHALAQARCGKFNSSIKKSGRPVSGFICAAQVKILLYLTLYAPS